MTTKKGKHEFVWFKGELIVFYETPCGDLNQVATVKELDSPNPVVLFTWGNAYGVNGLESIVQGIREVQEQLACSNHTET